MFVKISWIVKEKKGIKKKLFVTCDENVLT